MSILKSKIAKLALKLQLKHREYIEQPNTNCEKLIFVLYCFLYTGSLNRPLLAKELKTHYFCSNNKIQI